MTFAIALALIVTGYYFFSVVVIGYQKQKFDNSVNELSYLLARERESILVMIAAFQTLHSKVNVPEVINEQNFTKEQLEVFKVIMEIG